MSITTKTLNSSLVPEFTFAKIKQSPDGRKILHTLAKQYILNNSSTAGEAVISEDSWHTVTPNKDYEKYEVDDIVKLRECGASQTKSKVMVIAKDRTFLEKSSQEEADEYIKNKIAEIEGTSDEQEEEEESEATSTAAPKKSSGGSAKLSFIETLLKDHPIPTIDKDGFAISESLWRSSVRNIAKRKNVLIKGDSGLGKTQLVQLVADSFGLPLVKYDMGAMEDPISSLIGVHRLKEGQSVFDEAQFISDLQKPGIILLDEINRAPVTLLNLLIPLMDDTKSLNMSMASSEMKRHVKRHEDCIIMSTANIGNDFVGTSEIDTAIAERHLFLEMEYPTEKAEVEVLQKRCGIKKTDATKLVKHAQDIRRLYKESAISSNLSVRLNIEAGELVADGWSVVEAITDIMKPRMGEDYQQVADSIQAR